MKKEKFVEPKRIVQFGDIVDLQEQLSKFEQKRIGGRLVSRIEQYIASLGYARIDENGNVYVRDGIGYAWFVEIDQERLSYERRQMEKAGTTPKFDYSVLPKIDYAIKPQAKGAPSAEDEDEGGDSEGGVDMGLGDVDDEEDEESSEDDEDSEEK